VAQTSGTPTVAISPYTIPYSVPPTFEERFRTTFPLLYRQLRSGCDDDVATWGDVDVCFVLAPCPWACVRVHGWLTGKVALTALDVGVVFSTAMGEMAAT